MNDVMKKRLIGVAILVIIGVLTPLLLSRCMHGGSEDNGRGSMRVYNVQPDGKAEPAGNKGENSESDRSGQQGQGSESGPASSSGNSDQNRQAANPDTVSPQSQSEFSTPPVHGNSGNSSNTAPSGAGSSGTNTKQGQTSQPATREPASQEKPAQKPSGSHDYGSSSMSQSSQGNAQASNSRPSTSSGLEKSSIQGWVVQVASFSERGNAEDMARKLKGQFPVSYTPGQVSGKTWYRVNVGPFDSEQAAQSAADRLAKAGHKGLVRHLP